MDSRGNDRGRDWHQPHRVGARTGPASALWHLAWHPSVNVRNLICDIAHAALWLLVGCILMVGMQYGYALWTDAAPVRDVHIGLSVVQWPSGRYALDVDYNPVASRRCPSMTTHFIQSNPSGTLGRIPVITYSSGVAPVDKDGNVIPEPFQLVIPLPEGLPPGEYWHQSSRTTACDVVPGVQRNPTPSWTQPVPFTVP